MRKPGATPLGTSRVKVHKPRRGEIISSTIYFAPSGLDYFFTALLPRGVVQSLTLLHSAPGYYIMPLRGFPHSHRWPKTKIIVMRTASSVRTKKKIFQKL